MFAEISKNIKTTGAGAGGRQLNKNELNKRAQ
jgi:hypothetical protein